uniref:serine hydrolase n=1 Tax=Polynucleobacter sp. TaxID=2029855 RepID=UPI00404763B4
MKSLVFRLFLLIFIQCTASGHALADRISNIKFKSNIAYIIDADTQEVLYDKNSSTQTPIASITKIMAAMVILDAEQDLEEVLTISRSDVAWQSRARYKLSLNSKIKREEALLLGLMSSENRSMNALGRTYPGGKVALAEAMNEKAKALGMMDTLFVDPTGLSSENVSSARDLVILMNESLKYPLIKEYSTTPSYQIAQTKKRSQNFVNTNPIVRKNTMDVLMQKTGYITAAGRCLVIQAKIQGRNIAMVFLNSRGKNTRFLDAALAQKSVEKLLQE